MNMNHKSKVMRKAVTGIVLILLTLVFLVPLWWTGASALRPAGSLYEYANPLTWRTFFPEKITLDNFRNIFVNQRFGRALTNSLIVSVGTVLMCVPVCAMAGFALAKLEFPGKSAFFFLVLLTFMVPFEAIVVPLFLVVRRFRLDNTYWALMLPGVGNGLAIFLFKQFFEELPSELLEAARVDGASWSRMFGSIVMPMSKSVVLTVAVMVFLFQWNSMFWPLVATSSSRYQVVQVAVASQITTEEAHWANLFASAVAASLPPMILFLAIQRKYVQGISTTGLK